MSYFGHSSILKSKRSFANFLKCKDFVNICLDIFESDNLQATRKESNIFK